MIDPGIQVRKLTYEDVLPLVRVCNQAFLEHARFPEHGAQAAARLHDAPEWQWGAFENGRMLGFLLCEPRPEKTRVAIRLIAVAPGAQGRGVGGRLLSALEEQARRDGCPLLRVGTPFARGFYERHGFTCAEVDLKMIRDITRQAVACPDGVAVKPLDLESGGDVVARLGTAELKRKFLVDFLLSFRRDRGLAIRVERAGELLGVAAGRVPEFYRDFVEVAFWHAWGDAAEPLVKAFEFTVSTMGLRHVGFFVTGDREAFFASLGYQRSEQDFFWTMYTLEKQLG